MRAATAMPACPPPTMRIWCLAVVMVFLSRCRLGARDGFLPAGVAPLWCRTPRMAPDDNSWESGLPGYPDVRTFKVPSIRVNVKPAPTRGAIGGRAERGAATAEADLPSRPFEPPTPVGAGAGGHHSADPSR